jgi:hypothetical protein
MTTEEQRKLDVLALALVKLANPIHSPKTEEATLYQMEVEQIARAALKEAGYGQTS